MCDVGNSSFYLQEAAESGVKSITQRLPGYCSRLGVSSWLGLIAELLLAADRLESSFHFCQQLCYFISIFSGGVSVQSLVSALLSSAVSWFSNIVIMARS